MNRFRVGKKNPASQVIALRATLRDERIRYMHLLTAKVEQSDYLHWKQKTDAAIAEINQRIRATNAA
jgi:uncharacterized protein YceH (UPF0502 family)